jgi:PST family polysaccharide transporter
VIVILSRIAKTKVTAVLLGPSGVGLLGLYSNLIDTAVVIGTLGFNSAGVREIAAAKASGNEFATGRKRRALLGAGFILAIAGGLVFWLLSDWIEHVVLRDHGRGSDVAWLSIGVALSIAAASQGALLMGMNRVGDLARLYAIAGILNSVLGVFAIWIWPIQGLVIMVLLGPIVSFLLSAVFVARLGRPAGPRAKLSDIAAEWIPMGKLGMAFMVTGLAVTFGQLLVRTLVQRELGTDALGQFQAAWTISMTYLGFVLGAMVTDYYPRLTSVIKDHAAARRLINEQTEISILLCAPFVIGLLAFSPWVIPLLYTSAFGPAVDILRWQLLGDVFKVISWPIAFIQQASGAAKTLFLTETFAIGTYLVVVYFGLPRIGISATGVAYLVEYVLYLVVIWLLARRRIAFRWTRAVRMQMIAVILAAAAVFGAGRSSELFGAAVGGFLAAILLAWALVRISSVAAAGGRFGRLAMFGDKLTGWLRHRL